MKIAIVSQDFQKITGKTGRARNFLIYEVTHEGKPILLEKLEVPETQPTLHDLHEDDITPHTVDNTIVITSEAGDGMANRLSRRGITLYITDESNPLTAVTQLIAGTLRAIAASPHKDHENCLNE